MTRETAMRVQVTEFGRLDVTDDLPLDVHQLLAVSAQDLTDPEAKRVKVFRYGGPNHVVAGGRVGVVEIGGVVIEILPKIARDHEDGTFTQARTVMERLVQAYVEATAPRPAGTRRRLDPTRLEASRGPIGERVYELFVDEAEALIQRGLRSGYSSVEERLPYLRGRLNLGRQMRQPPGQAHRFNVRHRRFDANRPENRLIKTALLRVGARSAEPARRTTARQLAEILDEVPSSVAVRSDLANWDRGRLLAHYGAVEPWCRLVLEPLIGTRAGADPAEAILWRTERLFEMALESAIRRRLEATGSGWQLHAQGRRSYLGEDAAGRGAFLLKPDLLLSDADNNVAVIDAKWKLQSLQGRRAGGYEVMDEAEDIDDSDLDEGVGVSNDPTPGVASIAASDVYQLFAYGHHFLGGRGTLTVVYPASESFRSPTTYQLGDLTLCAVPYDLVADKFLMGRPPSGSAAARDLWDLLSHEPSDSTPF